MGGRHGVIIVAAGKGSRMRAAISKQYLLIQNKPIIVHTLELFQQFAAVDEIVLVVGSDDVNMANNWVEQYKLSKVSTVIAGGEERQDSVYIGLQQLSPEIEWVMIHDGVRPFVTSEAVEALLMQVKQTQAAVLAVPVKDTIKMVDDTGVIVSTPERSRLWAVHTPQAFARKTIIEAHEQAIADNFIGTDDAMLVERLGRPVHIVQSDYDNIKITTPDDLQRAESIMAHRGNRRN